MTLPILNQAFTFALGLGLGFLLCILYDFFRVIRMCYKPGIISALIQDMLFWIITAFLTFILLMVRADGQLRIFVFVAQIIGFVLARKSVSVVTIKAAEFLIPKISKFLKWIRARIFAPIYAVFASLVEIYGDLFKKSTKKGVKILKKSKKRLKLPTKVVYNEKERDENESKLKIEVVDF